MLLCKISGDRIHSESEKKILKGELQIFCPGFIGFFYIYLSPKSDYRKLKWDVRILGFPPLYRVVNLTAYQVQKIPVLSLQIFHEMRWSSNFQIRI